MYLPSTQLIQSAFGLQVLQPKLQGRIQVFMSEQVAHFVLSQG